MRIDMLETKVNYKSNETVKDDKSKNEFVSILDEKALDKLGNKNIDNIDKSKHDDKSDHDDKKMDDNLNEILAIALSELNIINGNKLQENKSDNIKENLEEFIDAIDTIESNLNTDSNNINEMKQNTSNMLNVKNINTHEIDAIKKVLDLIEGNDTKNFSEVASKNEITNTKRFQGDSKNTINDNSLSDLKNYILNILNETKNSTKLSNSNENLVANRNIVKVSKDDIDILNYIALDEDKFNKHSNLNTNIKLNNTVLLNENIDLSEDGQISDNKDSNGLTIESNNLDNEKNKKTYLENNLSSTLDRSIGIANIGNSNSNNVMNDNTPIVVRREFIKNDIVQAINYLKNNELEEINVTMNPKELGVMKISIIRTDDKSSYLISIANKDTLLMIKDNLNDIKSHLINMNLDNREVTVEIKLSHFENSFNENSDRQFNGNNNREEKKDRALIKENDSELENTVAEDTNINLLI
ncbi:flagellar hook-length control protein FliK [Clostridium sardiniense]|uniref:Flagellar hook-length control protein FliK n=1 Tax=Clostridium sardiniense TaxID=29369 RepID=A0ABS7KV15_CLOSR|nr:flagellar hook-length control protein FliK [Clostridium sardiniense]MBY0754658.1 flagellar hook-length control protein FliK [Clostridium sardiniense]MDQ0460622.1 flagellar hook-length control protein FliK [Clostridium sardiniense]